jgi:tetratricopeptide (TPR) repeat protein
MQERIANLRQLMADSKFVEAHKEAEFLLSQGEIYSRTVILPLYLELLNQLSKPLPAAIIIEVAESAYLYDLERSVYWLATLSLSDTRKFQGRILILKIKIAERQGQMAELYQLLSQFQIYLYEAHVPAMPQLITELIDKYFPKDFHLKLQRLALMLMLHDFALVEKLLKELILSCIERSSPKGTKDKYRALIQVLNAADRVAHLEIYKNLCLFVTEGVHSKKDFKRLAEIMIYLDDFELQVLVLHLLHQSQLQEVTELYAQDVRKNKNYSYVYFDKYYTHLKNYFFSSPPPEKLEVILPTPINFSDVSTTPGSAVTSEPVEFDAGAIEEELHLIQVLKYKDYSVNQLLEISVSFLQSQLVRAAAKAAELALEKAERDNDYLKATYMLITCLLQIGDYRGALDMSLKALEKARSQSDILSFLYGQAEAYIRLDEKKNAKLILKKIISIDAKYRLAKERLDKLNEI